MTEPLVSVQMITYNHAPFIVQAIEGVLQQKDKFPFRTGHRGGLLYRRHTGDCF